MFRAITQIRKRGGWVGVNDDEVDDPMEVILGNQGVGRSPHPQTWGLVLIFDADMTYEPVIEMI